jgi:hypothetical protein
MNIDALSIVNKIGSGGSDHPNVDVKNQGNKTIDSPVKSSPSPLFADTETKCAVDEATGLIQNITLDKITNKVIRKMPSDEYLHLLNLLDDVTKGSINKHI